VDGEASLPVGLHRLPAQQMAGLGPSPL